MGKVRGAKVSTTTKDVDHIRSDVSSFASSLGFSSAPSSSSAGFNDSDFRKTGRLKPHPHPPKNSYRDKTKTPHEKENKSIPKNNNIRNNSKFDIKSPQIQTPSFRNGSLLKERDIKFKNLPKLPLLKASAMNVWYKDAALLEEKVIGDNKRIEFKNVDERKGLVEEKKELGERLMSQYVHEYESSRGQSGDIKMLIATQRSGTAADKVSAFSVLVGDNPVANLRSIDMLLGMVTSKVGKRHALTAFEALKELFILSLLPDRKLKTLVQQPLNHLSDTKDGHSLLLFWYWEECLKERYERFVSALEEASQDVLDILRNKALKTMYTLLRSKSEQERRLLSALVNKLGHPENKIASNADYHLANLLADHPNMKAVVIDEVDNFLFRPHLGLRAKYHAVNFLSQIRLSHKGDGPKAAKHLIDIYFALFKVLISEASKGPSVAKQSKDEKKSSSSLKDNKPKSLSESHIGMDSRLLSALLTGVNRAFPFVSGDEADDVIEVQTPLLFQLVHSKNFNVGVQALMLLDKISSKNQIVSDRFYRALYSKLLLPAAISSSKEELFIGLMLRAMKNDVNIKRVAAFSKRLLQVALQLPPQHACGCLFLLSEVLKARPPLWNMVLQNESVDEDLEHFEDIVDDDNKQASLVPDNENNKDEVSQTSNESNSDNDSPLDKGGSMTAGSDEDDLSEAYGLLGKYSVDERKELKSPSDSKGGDHLQREKDSLTLPGGYNPRHREPSYCNADRVSWWELMVLASHVHPSVAAMARTLLSGANIVYSGNPLNDLSLGSFLDKFMEKKPRQSTWHGASQIEPAKKLDMKNQLIGPEIVSLAEEDVPPEDLVFHKFYMNKMNSSKKPKKKKKKTADDEAAEEFYAVDGDGDDDDDESDNEEIENVVDSANPALEVDGDYNYDDLDKIANEDDDDLIGRGSDEEDFPSDIANMEIDDAETLSGEDEGEDEDDIAIGEADDESEMDEGFNQSKKKQKSNRHSAASPFASLEDYQHLMDDSNSAKNTSAKKRSRKGKKKVPS